MLDELRNLFGRFGGGRAERHFGGDDARLALAALLVHAMAVDGAVNEAERAHLRQLLARRYRLSGDDLDLLVADALRAEAEATDPLGFTAILMRSMTEAERTRTVALLREAVRADGEVHEFEDNLVWRIAALLGVPPAAPPAGAGVAALPDADADATDAAP